MTPERFRTYVVILLTLFVGGTWVIGRSMVRSLGHLAENGRFVQLDRSKDFHDFGNTSSGGPTQVIDTRTGAIRQAASANP
jgi:hypothetical protein